MGRRRARRERSLGPTSPAVRGDEGSKEGGLTAEGRETRGCGIGLEPCAVHAAAREGAQDGPAVASAPHHGDHYKDLQPQADSWGEPVVALQCATELFHGGTVESAHVYQRADEPQ